MSEPHVIEIRGIQPEPWEAPTGARGRKGGASYVQMVKSEKLTVFQTALHDALKERYGKALMDPFPDPGHMELRLWVWRQIEATTRESGRQARGHVADATNLQKAIEDACQGVLFENDRDNLVVQTVLMEQGHETVPRIIIAIEWVADLPEPPTPDDVIDLAGTWEGNDVSVRREVDPDAF